MNTNVAKWLKTGVPIVLAAAASSAITYVVIRKKLDEEYEVRLEEELQSSIEFLVDQKIDLAKAQISNDEPVPSELDLEEIEPEPLEPIEGERVFGSTDEKPSLDDLAKNQKVQYNKVLTDAEYESAVLPPEPPYEDPDISVISRDIFMENGTDWEQDTLTYFADGGVLDDSGDFVDLHELLIGPGVPRFGELSEDANVVYVRNKKIQKEYEIISDPGNASEFLAHSLQDIYHPSRRR